MMFQKVKNQNQNTIRIKKTYQKKLLAIFIVLFAAIGASTIYRTFAATTLTIDATLPVPTNVRAYGDDRNIIVTWDNMSHPNVNTRVVGYYITYRPKGSNEAYKVKQQQVDRDWTWSVDNQTAVQIQPVTNGVEYEINVQSVSGSRVSKSNGNLVNGDGGSSSTYYVADGKVSNKSTTYTTASSARVDDMRNRLTSFFDDFSQPAGPFDELKWNTATTACIVPNTAAAFLNDQFHSHNQIRSSCDRAGIVSRPRGVFDISTATEANPAIIQFDVDGASQPRDTWYLDMIPLSIRPQTNLPVDVTSHNDLFDLDSEDPGNMVRINARSDGINYTYYNANRSSSSLANTNANGMPAASMRSPLPVPDIPTLPIPNVRNHWLVEITPTRMRVLINGETVAVKSLPAAFTSQQKFTLHSTVFSYNTGKQYNQVTPYVQMLHWDNFGFSGPAQLEVIHNYLEGGPTGKTPAFSTSMGGNSIPENNRNTIIPIPDQIGTLKNGKARLYFTMQDFTAGSWSPYNWSASHTVTINGKPYPVPNPRLNMVNPRTGDDIVHGFVPLAMTLDVNQSDIKQGDNTVSFNIGTSVLNVHLELPYDAASPNIPSYTQPQQVFGQPYGTIVHPPLTTCDQYWFVERDLGLPYESGRGNLITGPCTLIDGHSQTSTTPTNPSPSPSNQPPTSQISASTTSTTAPASYSVNAVATDVDGTVSKIELKKADSIVKTCASSPCAYNESAIAAGSYIYSAVATDNTGATTTSSQITVTVAQPTPPPTSNRFDTLPVNATLPSEIECASRVKPAVEVRPVNATPNGTRGVGGNYSNARVSGNYTGTTDEIIQWAACKWGMDEDILRAQMVQESYWHQSAIGDFNSVGNNCSNVYPIANYPAQYNGDSAHNNQCPESYGLSQVRWSYHKSAFYKTTSETETNLTNNAIYSTAYNADYWGSVWRSCYNGDYTWLNTVERGKDYSAGDAWGCLGMWFSGRWYTAPAEQYIANVQTILNTKVWTTTAFKNAQPFNTIPGSTTPTPPQDTTAPTVNITAPANNTTQSGSITVSANASDAVGVTRVSYYLDGSSTAFSNDSTSPYTSTWNTATVSNGTHTIRATAIDAAGNIGTSSTVTITVNNVVADTTAPITSIIAPANNAVVRNTVNIDSSSSDNIGVSKVELLINGTVAATDTTSPYRFALNTLTISDGNHEIRTHAYDAAGNNTYSAIVVLIVDNIPDQQPVCEDPNANNIGQSLPCTYNAPTPPAPTKPGDTNGDNVIDRNDLRTVLFYYNKPVSANSSGDLDGNGVVDRNDLRIMLYYYLRR